MPLFNKKLKKIVKKLLYIGIIVLCIAFFIFLLRPYQKPLPTVDVDYQKRELKRLNNNLPKTLKLIDLKNGKIIELPFAPSYGNPEDQILQQLKRKEKIDEIMDIKTEEFERFNQLRRWTYDRWTNRKITMWHPFNALAILNAVDKGYGGFCAHYAIVYLQAALSMGYQARYLDIFDHFLLEIWSNQYNKWIVIDPFNDCYYAWKDLPMSALEIHDKILENKKEKIKVIGKQVGAGVLDLYKHIAVVIRNDHYTYRGPWDHSTKGYFKYLNETRSKYYLSWKDKIYKEEFFMSEGRKEMLFSLFASDPDIFNWKINQIEFQRIEMVDNNAVMIHYRHNCPHWLYTLVEINGTVQKEFDPSRTVCELKKGENKITLRTVNVADIQGPEFYLTLYVEGV